MNKSSFVCVDKGIRKLENHKLKTIELHMDLLDGLPLDSAIFLIQETIKSLKDPVLFSDNGDIVIEGFIEMTPAQIKQEARKKEIEKNNLFKKSQKIKEKELQQLKELLKKYPDAIT